MERKAEQGLTGLKGRAIQPQDIYIHQPGGWVFHGLIQHVAGTFLLRSAGIRHSLDGYEDDICSFKRLEVFSKCLGGRKEDMSHQVQSLMCKGKDLHARQNEAAGSQGGHKGQESAQKG